MNITRPCYEVASVADALRSDWRGHHLSQKIDGIWTVRSFDKSIVTGETRAGEFFGFDIVVYDSQDMRPCAWHDRGEALTDCSTRHGFSLAQQGHGAEFINLTHWLIDRRSTGFFGRTFAIRADVLALLLTGTGSLNEIARTHGITRQAVERHLKKAKAIYLEPATKCCAV